MSNFDLTFCKVYVDAKGWPGINFGASLESGSHLTLYSRITPSNLIFTCSVEKYKKLSKKVRRAILFVTEATLECQEGL